MRSATGEDAKRFFVDFLKVYLRERIPKELLALSNGALSGILPHLENARERDAIRY